MRYQLAGLFGNFQIGAAGTSDEVMGTRSLSVDCQGVEGKGGDV
jgi:hypothetical protein